MYGKTISFFIDYLHEIIHYVSERIFRKNMKITIATDDKIRDEKLEHNINKEAAKMSALSSSKIDKYEFLMGEEI